jgi:type I restriction enzyme S subunit
VGPTNLATERCGIGRGLAAIRPGNATSADWILHYLRFSERRIAEKGTGTTFAAITGPVLAGQEIPLAPLREQRRIVARIDELFAEIDEGEAAQERARQGLDTWRRALLKAAVTGELTRDWREANRPAETGADLLARILAETGIPSTTSFTAGTSASPASLDTKSLPELPEGWAWACLGEIIESLRNGTAMVPVKRQTVCPILRISAVRPMAVDTSDIRYLDEHSAQGLGEFRTRPGDLLFTRYNGSRHLVGVCGIFRGEESVYYPDKIIRVRLLSQLQEISSFFEAAINSGATRKFIDGEIKTTAGQHGISGASLKRAPIPIPPIAEAERILVLLRDDLSRAEDMEALQAADLKAAAALRQSILKAAFEGRLAPQDPADEPASELLARLRNNYPGNGARRRRARAKEPFSHPSLPGLTRQSLHPRVEPAGDD